LRAYENGASEFAPASFYLIRPQTGAAGNLGRAQALLKQAQQEATILPAGRNSAKQAGRDHRQRERHSSTADRVQALSRHSPSPSSFYHKTAPRRIQSMR